jgi:hypothetical protein
MKRYIKKKHNGKMNQKFPLSKQEGQEGFRKKDVKNNHDMDIWR